MSGKTKVTLTIIFEDNQDFKMHMSAVRDKVNQFLKHPEEVPSSGAEVSSWSSHEFSIETNIE